MKRILFALSLVAFAGCADLEVRLNRTVALDGASSTIEDRRPEWQRDPTRGQYPYNARW